MACQHDGLVRRCAKEFWMQIESSVALRLRYLDWNAMCVRPSVLPDAGHLPGDFDVGLVRLDAELVVGHLAGDNGLRELANDRELVAKVPVQGLEPIGQHDHRVAL